MIYYHTSRDKITLPLSFPPLIPLPERSSSILLLLPPHCPSPLQYIPLSFLYLPVSTTVITLKRTRGQRGWGGARGTKRAGSSQCQLLFERDTRGRRRDVWREMGNWEWQREKTSRETGKRFGGVGEDFKALQLDVGRSLTEQAIASGSSDATSRHGLQDTWRTLIMAGEGGALRWGACEGHNNRARERVKWKGVQVQLDALTVARVGYGALCSAASLPQRGHCEWWGWRWRWLRHPLTYEDVWRGRRWLSGRDGRTDRQMRGEGKWRFVFFGVPEEESAFFLEFQIQMSCWCVWV